MTSHAVRRFRKSTIVRSYTLSAIRLVLGTSSRLAPGMTATWATQRFLKPPRSLPWREESAWLKEAESFQIPCGEHLLNVWTLGSGPTLLLVHGWGGRGSQLGALAAPLAARGFRVVGFDAPGHGDSSGRRSSIVEMAEAIVEVSRHVGVLHGVIAHSAGASATTFAIAQAGLKPQRLVFIAPGTDLKSFIDYFTTTLGLTREVGASVQRNIETRFDTSFKELSSLESAPSMKAPLLVLHDPLDRETPWEGSRTLVRRWPGAVLKPLPGVGHFRILRSEKMIDEALSFLGHPIQPHKSSAGAA